MNPLSGQRVMVLEDDYYVADDVREALDAAGRCFLAPRHPWTKECRS